VHLDPASPQGTAGQAIALEVSVLEPIDDDEWRDPLSRSSSSSSSTPPDDASTIAADRRRRKGWRIAWRQRASWLMPAWMLRSERVQEFVEVGEGETVYYCWETFYGVLAPVVRMAAGKKVEGGFGLWMEGLKELVEGQSV
jgi:hypothetical protein